MYNQEKGVKFFLEKLHIQCKFLIEHSGIYEEVFRGIFECKERPRVAH